MHWKFYAEDYWKYHRETKLQIKTLQQSGIKKNVLTQNMQVFKMDYTCPRILKYAHKCVQKKSGKQKEKRKGRIKYIG